MIQNCPAHSEPDPKRCRLGSEEGATLVETALSMSILLSIIFGIIQVCLAFYSYNCVAEAARLGTRYAMVRGSGCAGFANACPASASDVQTYIRGLSLPGINPDNVTVTTTWPTTGSACTPSTSPCNNPGNLVKVKVKYTVSLAIPFAPTLNLNMSSTSKMVISE